MRFVAGTPYLSLEDCGIFNFGAKFVVHISGHDTNLQVCRRIYSGELNSESTPPFFRDYHAQRGQWSHSAIFPTYSGYASIWTILMVVCHQERT
jgi:hypothetical protein